MLIEASILRDYLESLSEVIFCNIWDKCYEWADELVPEPEIDSNTLYICDETGLADYYRKRQELACDVPHQKSTDSEENPGVLLIVGENELEAKQKESGAIVFICRTQKTPAELSKLLQDYLRKLNDWKLEMDNAMLCGGMYQNILDLSEPILKNTIVITDYDYRLVAYTKNTPIDDAITNQLIQLGYYDYESIQLFKNAHLIDANCIPVSNKRAKKTKEGIGAYELMDYIYIVDGVFFAHLVMQCNNRMPTKGLEKLFGILVESIGHCVAKDWSLRGASGGREEKFVLALLESTTLRDVELVDLCERYGVPRYGEFRIHLFDIGQDCSAGQSIRDIRKILGPCWMAMKDGRVVALCANKDLSEKSQIANYAELTRYLELRKVRDGVSNLYHDIVETGSIFHESEIALQYGRFVVPCDITHNVENANLLFFDSSAIFWALDNKREEDSVFVKFLLTHNPIRELLDSEETANAAEDVKILYYYLHLDCNAASVAQSLYMHRNSIYYRIKKISENFNIDFDDLSSRVYLRFLLSWMRLEGYLDL